MNRTTNQPGLIRNFVSQFPAPLLARLHEAGSVQHYQDGQTIQLRGDIRQLLSIVLSGAVRMGTTGADGRFVSTVTLRPGDCHGELTLFANLPRPLDAEAVGETRINNISRGAFFRLMDEEPQLREVVLANLALQLAIALDRIDSLMRLPLPEQVAKILLEYSRQAERQIDVSVSATQAQLAASMGVTRLSAAKALNHLVDAGLVIKGYGSIQIPNRQALQLWLAERSEIEPIFT